MARHLRRTLSAEAASDAVSALAAWYVVALAGTLLVAGAVGWLLAQRALAPVEEMTRFARRISEERLGERLAPAGPPDELRELGETLDAMLDRLADAFDAQRRFLANASHELRTPLAVIRTEAEVALANPEPDVEELREVAVAVSESVVRTEALLDGLMLLARSQPGLLRPEPLELAEIALRVARQTSTEARSRDIDVRVAGDAAHTTGDRALVERLVANLVENGVRHNLPGGWVDVATGTDGDDAVVAVRNSGPVVAPEHIGRLTAPFERLGRHGDAPGAGLGLSIVQAVADAHGATLVIEPRPDGGLDVSVRFGRDPWGGSRRARGGAST
jgi:signal transduction histidine kinase